MSNKDTSCKECCFAQYERHEDGEEQVGCTLGSLDIHRANKVNVIGAYDDEKEFFVLENRRCPNYRTKIWAERVDPNSVQDFLKFENLPSFHVIIDINKDHTLDDVKTTFNGFVEQKEIKYHACTFIKDVDNTLVPPGELGHMGDSMNLMVPITHDQKIKRACKKTAAQFIVYTVAGHLPFDYLFDTIDTWMNKRLKVFGVVKLNDSGGYIIPKAVYDYWYYQGDLNKTVVQNIEEYQCKNQKKLIYQLEELLAS